ncbi:MAG: hypothetical protein WD273_05340 [Trueperaceae bacterium]
MLLRRVIPLGLLLMLALGTAQAQNWVGLRTGYPLGVTIHYGIGNMFSPTTDGRISANLRVRGSNVNFGVGFDVLETVHVESPFVVYLGGGPALEFGGSGALFEVHGLAGGEFVFSDLDLEELGIFAEFSLGGAIGIGRPSQIPTFGGAVGFNYRF